MFLTRKERAEAQSAENYLLRFFLFLKCLIIITSKNINTNKSPNITIIAEPKIAPNIAILTSAKIAVNTNNVNKIIIVPPSIKNFLNMFSLKKLFFTRKEKALVYLNQGF